MEAITIKTGQRQQARAKEITKAGKMDFSIFITVVVLCALGVVMVFSASYYAAQERMSDGLHFVTKQAQFIIIGIPAMLLISKINYRLLEKLHVLGVVVSIVLLVAVLIWGEKANGAKRWLDLGVSVQPSEIAKFGLMLYMSAFMTKKQRLMKDFVHGLVPQLLVMGVICGLVLAQPNMSMAVIIAMMGIIMLFIGGAEYKHIALLLLAGVGAFFLFALIEPYRVARLATFTDPWQDELGSGHQLIQSLYALGAGGLFGQGLNNSKQKLLYLTYGESDFVFSIVGEEIGFIGAALVICMYIFIIYRGIRVALRCKDRFGSLLAAGISIVFALQVLVNIGVVTGVMPTTGQALPFISAGGTSLLIFLGAMGVLLNISRYTNDE